MEQWKAIEGYDDYLISTLGNVDSLKNGKRQRLKPNINTHGYFYVVVSKENKKRHFQIHRLIANAFIPNPENKPEVNHINGIKTDNRTENLEWVTHLENMQHAARTELLQVGEKHHGVKLTDEQVLYIRENPDGFSQYKLAEKFKVHQVLISQIQLGKRRKTAGGNIREAAIRLTPEQRAEICRIFIKGSKEFGTRALGRKYNVDHSTIIRILNERSD